MKAKKLYCCFSKPQKDFLHEHGIDSEIKAKNCKTDCTMWIYIKTKELDKLLKEWSRGSKK